MNQTKQITVIKSDGARVFYDRGKLIAALKNSGVDENRSGEIALQVEKQIYDGITARKIYKIAYRLLKKRKSYREAGRYRLKKAIFDLGPSGFPFELFVAKLFEHFGYQVKTDQVIQGKCVQHEVDVVATNEMEQVIVECKFHSDYRNKTNVQVPLYINSRFRDIKEKWEEEKLYMDKKVRGYVITNARFTKDAVQYAECAGLGLISWDYPVDGSLKYFTDLSALHPVTSLYTLIKSQKKALLDKGIVLCKEIPAHVNYLRELNLSDAQIAKVLNEVKVLTATT